MAHHIIEQRTATRVTFQAFINELVVILAPRVLVNEEVFIIIINGARPHPNIVVPSEFEDRFQVVMLPPYCPFINPVEKAHNWLKSAIKQHLVLPHVQADILDIQNMRAEADLNQQQWRANVLLRIGNNELQQIIQQKCANWCARIHRYIPASLNREIIRN